MASQVPSIKGMLFQPVLDDVLALVARGRLSRTALEARLEKADVALLDEKVGGALWYPIDTYRRLLEVLRDVEGGARPELYLRQRGATAAQRLIDSGLYSQLDASIARWGERAGRIMVTLGAVIYNFSRWSSSVGEHAFQIEAHEAAPFPEVSRPIVEGFIEVITTLALGGGVRVRSERPTPDHIVFDVRSASAPPARDAV